MREAPHAQPPYPDRAHPPRRATRVTVCGRPPMRSILTSTALILLASLASACAAPPAENLGEQSGALRGRAGGTPQTPGPLQAFTVVLDGPSAASLIPRG